MSDAFWIILLILSCPIWIPIGYMVAMAIFAVACVAVGGIVAAIVWVAIHIHELVKPRKPQC